VVPPDDLGGQPGVGAEVSGIVWLGCTSASMWSAGITSLRARIAAGVGRAVGEGTAVAMPAAALPGRVIVDVDACRGDAPGALHATASATNSANGVHSVRGSMRAAYDIDAADCGRAAPRGR
jgi:hypothetical protein